ncbi:Hypothetical predicted protein [Mytilus galloprovincialis]|uniref:Sushi domain-containing protein n=2 Tax=Mytilus galloprovincialis TaxID=29158 RepID=A0A8B6DSY7_MYTGA|nr:Hypothetical predicted protein [Mytilus galloprovincialis]
MLKFYCVIAIVVSTFNLSYAGRLTRQCKVMNGTCGGKDLTCDLKFGTGWTLIGKCCGNRPCCKFQCENIQPPQFPNVTLTLTGLEIGAKATYICDSGLKLNGTMRLTCTASGWSDDIPTNCYDPCVPDYCPPDRQACSVSSRTGRVECNPVPVPGGK